MKQTQTATDNQAIPSAPQADLSPAPAPTQVQQNGTQAQQAEQPIAKVSNRYAEIISKPVSEWNLKPEELNNPKFMDSLQQALDDRKRLQAEYTKKAQYAAELEKKGIQPEWNKDFFLQQYQSNPAFQQTVNQIAEEFGQRPVSEMSEQERMLYEQQLKFNQLQQQVKLQESLWQQQYLSKEAEELDKRFDGNLKSKQDKVVGFMQASVGRGVSLEGAFKALDYDDAVKRAEERGFQKGLGAKNAKLTNQPITTSVPSVSTVGQPKGSTSFKDITEQAKKEYYARHGHS